MESRYKMVKLLVDNLIQGQLIVSPGKKIQTAAKFSVKDNFILIYCYSYNKILIKNFFYLSVINPFTPKSAWFSNII